MIIQTSVVNDYRIVITYESCSYCVTVYDEADPRLPFECFTSRTSYGEACVIAECAHGILARDEDFKWHQLDSLYNDYAGQWNTLHPMLSIHKCVSHVLPLMEVEVLYMEHITLSEVSQ